VARRETVTADTDGNEAHEKAGNPGQEIPARAAGGVEFAMQTNLTTKKPKRSKLSTPLRWHGGNTYLKQWMWSLAPHSVNEHPLGYTHRAVAFAGGLQDFWEMGHEGISEAVNDVNGWVSNFWFQLRENSADLLRTLTLTPFSQVEFEAAAQRVESGSPATTVRDAADFFIVHRQSRQSMGKCYATPTRRVRRGMNEQVSAFTSAVDCLPEFAMRLRQVEVRNQDFQDFIRRYDHDLCYHILDPPYLCVDEDGTEIRVSKAAYAFELSLQQHIELLELLTTLSGNFLLQGYPSKLYSRYADNCGWHCFSKNVDAKSSKKRTKRTEMIWTNYLPPER
jgi:DNA adenine methylase